MSALWGGATSALMLAHTGGFCRFCWQAERRAHEAYLRDHAIIVAAVRGGWTDDLFESELVIEQDGCYIHTVNWYGQLNQQQVECFNRDE